MTLGKEIQHRYELAQQMAKDTRGLWLEHYLHDIRALQAEVERLRAQIDTMDQGAAGTSPTHTELS